MLGKLFRKGGRASGNDAPVSPGTFDDDDTPRAADAGAGSSFDSANRENAEGSAPFVKRLLSRPVSQGAPSARSSPSSADNLPSRVFIEFMPSSTWQEAVAAAEARVNHGHYAIVPWNGGHLIEVRPDGARIACLKDLVMHLDAGDREMLLPLRDGHAMIVYDADDGSVRVSKVFEEGSILPDVPILSSRTPVDGTIAPPDSGIDLGDEDSLPLLVNIDFLRGASLKDAESYAKAFIERNFVAPNASFYAIEKWRDGILVEMQEGGGKSHLPHIIAELDSNDEANIAVLSANRVLSVRYNDETDRIECLLLKEGERPPHGSIIARPTGPMKPLDRRGVVMFVSGAIVLGVSFVGFLLSLAAFLLDKRAWVEKTSEVTAMSSLPLSQQDPIAQILTTSDCIARMSFENDRWTILPGYNVGGVCRSSPPADAQPSVVDPAQAVASMVQSEQSSTPGTGVPVTAPGSGAGSPTSVPTQGASSPVQ